MMRSMQAGHKVNKVRNPWTCAAQEAGGCQEKRLAGVQFRCKGIQFGKVHVQQGPSGTSSSAAVALSSTDQRLNNTGTICACPRRKCTD